MRRLIPILIGLALAISGCANPSTTPATLENTTWIVTAIDGQATSSDHQPTMAFGAGQVTGSASCNRYTGAYTQTSTGISFSQVIITQVACDDSALVAQEARFTAALGKVTKLAGSATDPELCDASGKVVLKLTQPTPVETAKALTGTDWSLSAITSADATTAVITGSSVTLQIGETNFTATSCDSFTGDVAINGSNIKFTAANTTSTGCDSADLTNQMTTVANLLSKVESWSISDSTLTLSTADGAGLEFTTP